MRCAVVACTHEYLVAHWHCPSAPKQPVGDCQHLQFVDPNICEIDWWSEKRKTTKYDNLPKSSWWRRTDTALILINVENCFKIWRETFWAICFSNWYNCKIVSWTTQNSIVWHNISAPNYRNNKVENTKRKIQHSKILSVAPQTRGTYGECNYVYLPHLRDQRVPFSFIKMCVSPNKLAFKPHLTNK